jgi:hypothetical protein
MGKNWKTTATGSLLIAQCIIEAIVAYLQGHPIDYGGIMIRITAGIGLLAAKDSNVTGGTVKQSSK